MNLSERINELLNLKNWTYYRLSKDSGVPMSTINNIRTGRSKSTSDQNLLKIANAFGITVSELLGEKESTIGKNYIEVAKYAEEKNVDPKKLKSIIDLLINTRE